MNSQQPQLAMSCMQSTRDLTKVTHVSFAYRRNYVISPDKKKEFWIKYCDMVYENREGDNIFDIGEIPLVDNIPLFADLKFRFTVTKDINDLIEKEDRVTEPFDARFTREIIRRYQRAISKNMSGSCVLRNYICMVMQSPIHIVEERQLNKVREIMIVRLRLQFPYCGVNSRMYRDLRNDVIISLNRDDILGQFNVCPLDGWDVIIKDYDTHEPVPMYGSIGKNDTLPMEYQYHCELLMADTIQNPIYEYDEVLYKFGEKPHWPDCFSLNDATSIDYFPLYNHKDLKTNPEIIAAIQNAASGKDKTFYLPLILSLGYNSE